MSLVIRPGAGDEYGGSGSPRFVARALLCSVALVNRPVMTAFSGLAELHGVRRLMRRAADMAGFGDDARDCAVLAVHEAAVQACRLVERFDDRNECMGPACTMRAVAERGAIVAEIDLGRPLTVPRPSGDEDPFRYVRLFSSSVTFPSARGSRRVRVENVRGD